MSTISVNLPSDLQDFVRSLISGSAFANEADYIVALVDSARRQRTNLETALMEGIESGPAEPWTDAEFAEMTQRVVDRDWST